MSDPSAPKGRPDAPAEGPTKAFRLKFDGWMTELIRKDLGVGADAPDASSGPAAEPAVEPDPAAPPAGNAPDGTGPGEQTGRSSG